MNLPEAIRRQKENFVSAVDPDTVEVMQSAIEDLANSDILKNSLGLGEKSPDFSLEDSSGKTHNLSTYLDEGNVILKFFRGDW